MYKRQVRALYIFPTKALAQDQLAEVDEMCKLGKFAVKSFTFDGDTPTQKRRLAKEVGQIIITNPDMLHQAILPHHPTWVRLFASLKYLSLIHIWPFLCPPNRIWHLAQLLRGLDL